MKHVTFADAPPMLHLPQGFTITAHAGAMHTQDNTLDSVRVGLENADIVEFDLTFTAAGAPVLWHDNPPPADAVPLAQAFALLAQYPNKRANVDLKSTANLPEVQRLAQTFGVLDQIFFTGVGTNFVAAVRTHAPQVPYYLNRDIVPLLKYSKAYANALVRLAKTNGAVGLNCNYRNVTPVIVAAFHKHGMPVSLWTARDKRAIEKIFRLAADNLTTTMPDTVRAMLNERRGSDHVF